jgi:hypothetical protein
VDFSECESLGFSSTDLLDGEYALLLLSMGLAGGLVGLFLLPGSSKSIFKTEDEPNLLGSGGGYFGFVPFVLSSLFKLCVSLDASSFLFSLPMIDFSCLCLAHGCKCEVGCRGGIANGMCLL